MFNSACTKLFLFIVSINACNAFYFQDGKQMMTTKNYHISEMFLLISIGPIRGQGKLGPGACGGGDGHVGVSVVVGGDLPVSGDVIVRPGELLYCARQRGPGRVRVRGQ